MTYLAEQFRATVEATNAVTEPPIMGGRLALARAWYPTAFAAVDEVIHAANAMYPDACLSVIGIARTGWHDQIVCRIGDVKFLVDEVELAWDIDRAAPSVLPRAGDPEAEASFGRWLVEALAAYVRKKGFVPAG